MPTPNPVQRATGAAVGAPVALFVSRLPGQELWMVNNAGLDLAGAARAELTDMPGAPDTVVTALAAGAISSCQATRRLQRRDGADVDVAVWVRSVNDHSARYAVALMVPRDEGDTTAEPAASPFATSANGLAVGTTDSTSQIGDLASDRDLLLGGDPGATRGTYLLDLVHPADAAHLAEALLDAADHGADTTVTTRVRHVSGSWVQVHCMFFRGPNPEADSLGFALAEPPGETGPVHEGERAAP